MKTLTEDKIKSMSKDQIDTYLSKIDNAITSYSQQHKKIFSMMFSSSEDSEIESDNEEQSPSCTPSTQMERVNEKLGSPYELKSNSNNMEVEKKVKRVIKKKMIMPVEVMSDVEVEMKPEVKDKKKVVRKKVMKEMEVTQEMPAEKEEKPVKGKKGPSAWVKHVLEQAKKMGISYKEALSNPEVKKKYKK